MGNMSEEPYYVDDPFEEEDNWWNSSDIQNQEVLDRCFQITRRSSKRFAKKPERSAWERIDKGISAGKIPPAWVENCIQWAAKKNAGAMRVPIKFSALTNLIRNKARMQDWLADNPEAAAEHLEESDDFTTGFDD